MDQDNVDDTVETLEQLNKEWKEHIEDEYTTGYVGLLADDPEKQDMTPEGLINQWRFEANHSTSMRADGLHQAANELERVLEQQE